MKVLGDNQLTLLSARVGLAAPQEPRLTMGSNAWLGHDPRCNNSGKRIVDDAYIQGPQGQAISQGCPSRPMAEGQQHGEEPGQAY